MDRLEEFRSFFASLITANAGLPTHQGGVTEAFASVPRERFVGSGPWKVLTPLGYIQTPSGDPAFLYQDVTVALVHERLINNGQPMLHAVCLSSLNLKPGETAVHVGAGTGYYTALLHHLVGAQGSVVGYEIEEDLARRAAANLQDRPNVRIEHRSGAVGPLPDCDAVYVNAGATAPLDVWLDALRPGGRLLFPLTPAEVGGKPGIGGMLLVTRRSDGQFDARFVCSAAFIGCAGARDEETANKLTEAFKRGTMRDVRSLRRGTVPDESNWVAGNGWWLSTAVAPA